MADSDNKNNIQESIEYTVAEVEDEEDDEVDDEEDDEDDEDDEAEDSEDEKDMTEEQIIQKFINTRKNANYIEVFYSADESFRLSNEEKIEEIYNKYCDKFNLAKYESDYDDIEFRSNPLLLYIYYNYVDFGRNITMTKIPKRYENTLYVFLNEFYNGVGRDNIFIDEYIYMKDEINKLLNNDLYSKNDIAVKMKKIITKHETFKSKYPSLFQTVGNNYPDRWEYNYPH